jgi:hypothetical protein
MAHPKYRLALPMDVIMFAVMPTLTDDALEAQKQLKEAYLKCLKCVNERGLKSLAFAPMLSEEEKPLDVWALAQAAVELLKEIAYNTVEPSLKLVEFVKGSLLLADTFTSVFNRIVMIDETNTPTTVEQSSESVEEPQNAGSSEPSEWHEIECVLKRQKRSGKDMFLVSGTQRRRRRGSGEKTFHRPRYNIFTQLTLNADGAERTRPIDAENFRA